MKDTSIAIMMIIAIVMLTIALLSETKNNYNKEIELKNLQQQKNELQTENENLKKGDGRKQLIPVNIDCEKDIKEGDIRVNVQMEVYNPFGEWIEITEDNVEYQLNYGSRIVNCK